jgi:hypothetical protein
MSLALGTRVGNSSRHHRRRHAWGTYLNNIITLPGDKDHLVRTLFTMRYSMDRYKEDKTSHNNDAPGRFPSPDKHRCDKTGRRLTGMPSPLIGWP